MKHFIFLFFLNCGFIIAQVGIGNTSPNALLDIRSSNELTPSNTDGLLIPKVEEFPTTNPTAAQDGMLVYVTGNGSVPKGIYYWDNTASTWISPDGAKSVDELTDGRTENDGSNNGSSIFLGRDAGLNDDNTNNGNTGLGYQALMSTTSGSYNVALGYASLRSNTTGLSNVGLGFASLLNNINGLGNIGIGINALRDNTSGSQNVAIGPVALLENVSGDWNVAIGPRSGNRLVSGEHNTFMGRRSGYLVNSGDNNVLIGASSGSGTAVHPISGSVFIGYESGFSELNNNRLYIENSNSAAPLIYGEFDNDILGVNGRLGVGTQAPETPLHVFGTGAAGAQDIVATLNSDASNRPVLQFSETANSGLTEGMSLEYDGRGAGGANRLVMNDIGGNPLFEFRNGGDLTLRNGDIIIEGTATDREIKIDDDAGNPDRALMRQTGTQDIYVGDIDNNGGDTYIRAGGSTELSVISGSGFVGVNTTAPAFTLEVNGNAGKPGGGSWINSSDRRLKKNIKSYTKGIETLLKIKPVSYQYNALSGFDQSPTHVGVIAQELQEVAPSMVMSNERENEAYLAVDNSEMTYLLINAVKEQQAQIEFLKQEISELKKQTQNND